MSWLKGLAQIGSGVGDAMIRRSLQQQPGRKRPAGECTPCKAAAYMQNLKAGRTPARTR